MEFTSIEVFGILIHEPVTSFTDLIVSMVCFYAFLKLNKIKSREKVFQYFKYYFLLMCFATALGGLLGHAFLYAFSFAWKLPGWITSMLAIMLIERAAIEHTKIWFQPNLIKFLKILNIIELALFMSLTFYFLNFFFVEIHSGYGLMFVVLSLQSVLYYNTKNQASKYILFAIGVAAISALFFMTKIEIYKWFNYIDASHIFMSISAFLFMKGALKIDMSEVSKNKKKVHA